MALSQDTFVEEIKARPNPFAFPSETHGRFLMLIVGAIVLTWQLSFTLFGDSLVSDFEQVLAIQRPVSIRVQAALGPDNDIFGITNKELAQLAQDIIPLHRVLLKVPTPSLFRPTLITSALLGIAWLLYRFHPRRQRPDKDVTIITRDTPRSEPLWDVIQPFLSTIGRQQVPVIEHIASDNDTVQASAFGFRHQSTLLLVGKPFNKLVRDFAYGNEDLIVRVLHELGHIVSRDAWRTYAAESLWLAFTFVNIVSLCFIILFESPLLTTNTPLTFTTIASIVTTIPWLKIGLLYLFVWGTWRGLRRIREYYADNWAAQQTQDAGIDVKEALVEHFAEQTPAEQPVAKGLNRWRIQAYARWYALWQDHPTAQQRRVALQEPLQLFQLSRDLPFLTGCLLALLTVGLPLMLVGIIVPLTPYTDLWLWQLVLWVAEMNQPWSQTTFIILLLLFKLALPFIAVLSSIIVIGYFTTHTLGTQIQRDDIGELLQGRGWQTGYRRLLAPAFWLSSGVFVGILCLPGALTFNLSPTSVIFGIVWVLGFTALTWLWLVVLHLLTRILLGTRGGHRPPRITMIFINVVGMVLLTALYVPALYGLAGIPFMYQASNLSASNPNNMVFMIGFTLVVFLGVALAFYFLMFFCFLGPLLLFRLFTAHEKCPTCGIETRHKIVIGHYCDGCGQTLAPWVYESTATYTS